MRFTPQFILRSTSLSVCTAALLFLSGCAGITDTAAPGTLAIAPSSGSVYGGQQPIIGAHVYLYAAKGTAYGSAATSLMTVGASGTATDGNGVAYVTTAGNGGFSYGGDYTGCTSGTQIYLLALGGNAYGVGGPSNSAIALAAALGDCANLTTSTFTDISEVTTVGAAYALQGFMTDATHVGATSSNINGLKNAFLTASNLVNNTTGAALTTTPGGNGTVPQTTINTLANIIASCVNSASGSTACSNLMATTSYSGLPTPTNTLAAMLNIAAQPGAQTTTLFNLAASSPPFQPSLSAVPNDFALGITYSPSISVVQPGPVVIDASGNIWMANCQSCVTPTATDSIVEYGPTGTFLHSYSNAGIHNTKGLALDANGANIYSLNQAVSGSTHTLDQLTKMSTTTGAVQSGFPVTFASGTYGTNSFNGIAIDNSGEIWVTATTTGAVVELTSGGSVINGGPFFVGGTAGVGIDNIGNVWFAGVGGNNLLQFDTNGNFLNNFTPSGMNQPVSIAINNSNQIWSINSGSSSLSAINFFNGSNATGSPYTDLGLYQATVAAIDGANRVLIPNCRVGCAGSGSTSPDNLLRISAAGDTATGGSGSNAGVQSPAFSGATGAAIDASGNVWVSDNANGKVTEVIGFASPTIQPLAKASSAGTIGTLP